MNRLAARGLGATPPIALFAIVLLPWMGRLQDPSLAWDDVQRIIDLQTLSLPARLIRPFNEHWAPTFELLTAAAWECAGHRLEDAPAAFMLASYLPYALSLGMLWVLARREWRSPTVAGVAVALFAATPIYAECVLWFSASTFTWALLFTLVALGMAGLAGDRGSAWCAAGSAAACLLAPTGSAIGLLAGPVATIRAWPGRRPSRAQALALVPSLGTLANLAIAGVFRDQSALSRGVRALHDVPNGLVRVVQAPLYLVLAGYGGVGEAHRVVPYSASAAFLVAGLALMAAKAARGPADERRWLAIGTLLIVGGYAMIYCFRTLLIRPDSLVKIQRYHLFPCLGLVLLLAAWAAPRLRRLDGRPVAGPALVLGLAAALIAVNRPLMEKRMRRLRLDSGQRPVLSMIDRVADVARSRGLARDQVIRAFEPLEPRWSLAGSNVLRMLPEVAGSRPNGFDADRVRAAVREGLSARDRALLAADMNATALLRPGASWARAAVPLPGRLVASHRIRPLDRPGLYWADGWPSHLEWTFPAGNPSPLALSLPGLAAGKTLEVWWARGDLWSPDRRVVVRLDRAAAERSDWALPLDCLPNFDAEGMTRIRITVRESGPVTVGTPALLR